MAVVPDDGVSLTDSMRWPLELSRSSLRRGAVVVIRAQQVRAPFGKVDVGGRGVAFPGWHRSEDAPSGNYSAR